MQPSDSPVRLAAIIAFIVYVVVQIGLPALQLTGPRPSRFGWHMFAGLGTLEAYEVAGADGSIQRIDHTAYFGNWRSDLVVPAPLVAAHICAHRLDAVGVRITDLRTAHTRELPCGPQ